MLVWTCVAYAPKATLPLDFDTLASTLKLLVAQPFLNCCQQRLSPACATGAKGSPEHPETGV
eukprot:3008666-Amphidinium_carterae.1